MTKTIPGDADFLSHSMGQQESGQIGLPGINEATLAIE